MFCLDHGLTLRHGWKIKEQGIYNVAKSIKSLKIVKIYVIENSAKVDK